MNSESGNRIKIQIKYLFFSSESFIPSIKLLKFRNDIKIVVSKINTSFIRQLSDLKKREFI